MIYTVVKNKLKVNLVVPGKASVCQSLFSLIKVYN